MAILTKEQIFATKTGVQLFKSEFWGGEIEHRLATSGDKIAARQLAPQVAELAKDKGTEQEHYGVALIKVCSVNPKFDLADVVPLLEQNGTEVSRFADALVRRPNASDPIK